MDAFNSSWVLGYGIEFGWIIGLIILGVFILFVLRYMNQSHRIYKPGIKIVMDILNDRYVNGEINKEEFEEKKKNLKLSLK